jgi:hypothetical protein
VRRVALVAISGAILFAACGGGGSDASTSTTTGPRANGLSTWAENVCGNMSVWDAAMARVRTAQVLPATPADVTTARDTLAGALGDAVAASDTLLGALAKAGPAPLKGGDAASVILIKTYRAARDAIGAAQAGAMKLAVDSIDAFTAGRASLGAALAQAIGAASAALANGPTLPALDEAFQDAQGCAPPS